MIRRTGGAGIHGRYQEADEADVNPLETVANLSDVMLVLAVALMIALISHWGVNVNTTQMSADDLTQVEDEVAESLAQNASSGQGFEEVGTMYRDTETGEVYVLSK